MAIQYAGGTNVNATFTGATKADILSNVKTQLVNAGWSLSAGALQATVTITIASPGVVTFTSHGLPANHPVIFTTTGALPTGLTAGTKYFVRNPTTNTFEVSATSGGASINTSGSQSGTHTCIPHLVMQSAATPQSLAIRVRLADNNGSCVQFSLENTAGTLAGGNSSTAGGNLLPAGAKTFRVIANKYQFFVLVPAVFATPRNYVAAGVPYIPSPLSVPAEAGWLISDGASDSGTSALDSWRVRLVHRQSSTPNIQMMWGATLWENANSQPNSTNVMSLLNLVMMNSAYIGRQGGTLASGNPALYRWVNDDIMTSDALLAWGSAALGDEPKIRCQMWDALIIHDSFTGDTTTTFDSKSWFGLTDSQVGTQANDPRGCLFVVIP